ncbi:ACP S-malonyltransferase [Marinomonas mediterranea]|jgi:[Acyl-carrier-protein] S-malonyltransferase (EC 2.3.1.39)|uniref:Malonyl CoA-acyl carrier protein transacylase n=1 Tax=Marinomonas mediterranea (strain ATCC 700492 / JCM 21426 / NBRC 103028 / MMB-1) TaxID=717774 RepID=F2K3B4_MARM1|nr:ACP S-malonyltransferase [Marinomonas mediterranea]ADZ91256.1 malonyl CoA-acyl carrier protein transacylase [Marinomonas mediterranea MMB-1]WCN13310.1 ACP S-malonyltransferase [Marinomonas mediterranea]WCN17378.1 ACP S-malonyltransferase [Marinomonas mediterranea MMB-1]
MNNELAFVFPGQGSQALGMLADLAEKHDIVTATFAEASEILGYDLWDLVQNDSERLNQTDKTQPALLTASVALWRLWEELGGDQPAYVAGHSLGEYSALVCAGVIEFKDAVELVKLRGEFMQTAVPAGEGAMAAIIGLADEDVVAVCAKVESGVVSAVNFNSPGQVVIAGHKEPVEQAMANAKEAGAKRALPLPVSVPSHCELMIPAGEKLAVKLDSIAFNEPKITLVQNVSAEAVSDAAIIKKNLVAQLSQPVLWTQSVQLLSSLGVVKTIECGPGKVLSGLNKRIVKGIGAASIGDLAGLEAAL